MIVILKYMCTQLGWPQPLKNFHACSDAVYTWWSGSQWFLMDGIRYAKRKVHKRMVCTRHNHDTSYDANK